MSTHDTIELTAALKAITALKAEVERLQQYHGGHLPTCGGIDEAERRCGCGYLQGEAYRELYDEREHLKGELETAQRKAERLQQLISSHIPTRNAQHQADEVEAAKTEARRQMAAEAAGLCCEYAESALEWGGEFAHDEFGMLAHDIEALAPREPACPECGGCGQEGTGQPNPEGGEDWRECYKCGGTGAAPREGGEK